MSLSHWGLINPLNGARFDALPLGFIAEFFRLQECLNLSMIAGDVIPSGTLIRFLAMEH